MSSTQFNPSTQPGPTRPVTGRRPRNSGSPPAQPSSTRPNKRRSRGVVPPEAPKKANRDPYHMKKADIPDDATGFKAAFETHIRILIGAYSSANVPQPPTLHDIRTFEQRYTNAADVDKLLRTTTRSYVVVEAQVTRSLEELRAGCARQHGSSTSQIIAKVPEHTLRLIFSAVHEVGLSAWRPNLLAGTPTSLYNAAHEAVAIWTFEQALISFGYRTLAPNMTYIRNTAFVKKVYMNFVWSYLKGLVVKENKEPGSVLKAVEANKAYKLRTELLEKRADFFRSTGFPNRVQLLLSEPECVSDHEPNPAGSGFLIMRKRARNDWVTDCYRWADREIASHDIMPLLRGQQERKNKTTALPRVPHPEGKESAISIRLPVHTTLDWFTPAYFNRLDIRFRARYVNAAVALPLQEDWPGTDPYTADWKTMDDNTFMERYGNRVRARYNLPTEEEIATLADDEGDQDDDDDDDQPTPMSSLSRSPSATPTPTPRLALSAPPA